MSTVIQNAATVLVVSAAIAVAGANVHREFFSPPARPSSISQGPPTYVTQWKDYLRVGTLIGDSAAPVKVIEFADLECPGCRMLNARIRELPAPVRAKMAVVFVHFPLPMHRFALLAARAAECGRAENRFGPLVDVLFDKQDSLGLKSWVSYARDAGVRDTVSFARCASGTDSLPMVIAGRSLGKRIDIAATPTVIINGWRFSSPPYDSLASMVSRLSTVPTVASVGSSQR